MSLTDFAAKAVTCKIELLDGSKVELTFRPFTLADLAWLPEAFPTEEEALENIKDAIFTYLEMEKDELKDAQLKLEIMYGVYRKSTSPPPLEIKIT